ncbi:MAG TPA: hypothetical protein VD859_06285 [Nocardioides sp.]|nr:hypothetical protein [Nocardioides sp.]
MAEWAALYADHVAALSTLALRLDDDALGSHVPATPAWTVGDVLRHVAGGAADHVTGRMDGAPTPEWTARHVSERVGLTVADLVAELRGNSEGIGNLVAENPRPAVVWDIAVHHADLREALGLERLPEPLWEPVMDAAAEVMLGEAAVTVRAAEREYGAGGPVVDVAPYELFRALFSRRSRAQIGGWAGGLLGAEQVCIFGPREDDQPLPA